MPTDNTEKKQRNLIPFKPGTTGNPGGRPKGARNNLAEAFLDDLVEAWEREGAAAIQRVIETKPAAFLKIVADLMPKDMNLTVNRYDQLTDEQLMERVRFLTAAAAPLLLKQ